VTEDPNVRRAVAFHVAVDEEPGMSTSQFRVSIEDAEVLRTRLRAFLDRPASAAPAEGDRRDVVAVFGRPGKRPLVTRCTASSSDVADLLKTAEEMDR
jgi:hypothetical protein